MRHLLQGTSISSLGRGLVGKGQAKGLSGEMLHLAALFSTGGH